MASSLTLAVSPQPLYVDLDGTLIATDLLHESLLQLVRSAPGSLLSLPWWLVHGKSAFKRKVALHVDIDVATLPYRPAVLELIRNARVAGRRVVLATASDAEFARKVADHLGLFDAVLASDGLINMRGAAKLKAIQDDAEGEPFCYAGDSTADLDVWSGAAAAVVVSRSHSLVQHAARLTKVDAVIEPPATSLRRYLYGMRLHQWLKNVLVFLPLMPVLHNLSSALLLNGVFAFFAFGLAASAVYIVNDLLDLQSDRLHHRKRSRPFAAGEISVLRGLALATGLALASLAFSLLFLPKVFLWVLLFYVALTTAYSLFLKRRAVVDVFSLAGLYTVRVAAGTAATGQPLSFWILSFSLFIFLSLALAKRYVELTTGSPDALERMTRDRGYQPGDVTFVLSAGVAAGQMSALLLSLYLQDSQMSERYVNPVYLWALIPVFLFWVMRIWLKAIRGALHDDPVVFAARDWVSRLAVGMAAVVLYLAG